jgi:hypothetical protein
MTIVWFIVWLIANNVGGHEPLLFNPVNAWTADPDPRHRTRSGRRPRTRDAEEPLGSNPGTECSPAGSLLLRATSIGLIERTTPLHPPGAPEVDASRQPEGRDRALSNSVATPGQAAVLEEAVGACHARAGRHQQTACPRSSDAAARRAIVSDPSVALLSSPRRRRQPRAGHR